MYTHSFEVYIHTCPEYKPSNITYRSVCSLENLDDLEMASYRSGERSEVEPVQDEVGLPAATGVMETSKVCLENPTRDGKSGFLHCGRPIYCVGLGKGQTRNDYICESF